MAGVAIIMIIGQLGKVPGIHASGTSTVGEVVSVLSHLAEANRPTVVTSVALRGVVWPCHAATVLEASSLFAGECATDPLTPKASVDSRAMAAYGTGDIRRAARSRPSALGSFGCRTTTIGHSACATR